VNGLFLLPHYLPRVQTTALGCIRLYMQKLLIAFMFVKLILSLNSCDFMDEIDSKNWGTWGMQNLGNN